MEDAKATWVNFQLDSESNSLVMESCRKSKRSKRHEVELRLRDHIRRFDSIAEVGKAELRKIHE